MKDAGFVIAMGLVILSGMTLCTIDTLHLHQRVFNGMHPPYHWENVSLDPTSPMRTYYYLDSQNKICGRLHTEHYGAIVYDLDYYPPRPDPEHGPWEYSVGSNSADHVSESIARDAIERECR